MTKGKKLYGYTTDQCTMLMAQVEQAKQKRSKQCDKKKRFIKHELNVMVLKQVKKVLKQKRKRAEELLAFEKKSVSNSDYESISIIFSEEGEM